MVHGDVHVMACAAKHNFNSPISQLTPSLARRSQRAKNTVPLAMDIETHTTGSAYWKPHRRSSVVASGSSSRTDRNLANTSEAQVCHHSSGSFWFNRGAEQYDCYAVCCVGAATSACRERHLGMQLPLFILGMHMRHPSSPCTYGTHLDSR